MKGLLLIGLFFIQTLFVFGQSRILTDDDYNTSGAIKLTFVTTKTDAIELAKYDMGQLKKNLTSVNYIVNFAK